MPQLSVILQVHQRHEMLMPIVRQISALRCADLLICYDRPSLRVKQICSQIVNMHPDGIRNVVESVLPFPILSPGRPERWGEARNFVWEQRAPDTTHGIMWDDDQIVEDLDELRKHLYHTDFDLVYATKAFFWDDAEHVNEACFKCRSPFLFRALPGDRFSESRVDHCPQRVHDNPRSQTDLQCKLLDFGYLKEEDRLRVWEAYKRCGKIDAATTPLIQPPRLVPYTGKRDIYYDQAAKSYRN